MSELLSKKILESLKLPPLTEDLVWKRSSTLYEQDGEKKRRLNLKLIQTYSTDLKPQQASIMVLSILAHQKSQLKASKSLPLDEIITMTANEIDRGMYKFPYNSTQFGTYQVTSTGNVFTCKSNYNGKINVHVERSTIENLLKGNAEAHNRYLELQRAANAWVIKNQS